MDDRALHSLTMQVVALHTAVSSLLATAANKPAILDNFNVHAEAVVADVLNRPTHDHIVDDLAMFLDQYRRI